jgi:hypothetical protein
MEWIILLAIISGGYFLYQRRQSKPAIQASEKAEAITVYSKQADEAYVYLSTHLDDLLKKEVPRWVEEAKKNLTEWKKSSPHMEPPDLITYQPENQEARKVEIEKDIAELKRVRDKFVRVMLRKEHNNNIDMKLEAVYDWNQWIVRKADAAGWHGYFEV